LSNRVQNPKTLVSELEACVKEIIQCICLQEQGNWVNGSESSSEPCVLVSSTANTVAV